MARSNSIVRALGDVAVIGAFAAALVMPSLRGSQSEWTGERRQLADKPAPPRDFASLVAFPAAYEKWFNDHFGFRSQLLALNTRVLMRVFGISSSEQVVMGTEGWLYYTRDGIFQDRRGEERLSESTLERWRGVLEGRSRWFASQGVRYVYAVAPNKLTIYPDHLPPRHRPRPDVPTRMDQLVAHLGARSTFQLIDGRPLLREAAKLEQVYHSTDSHWNELGAHVLYSAIVADLRRQGLEITALPRASFTVETRPYEGDLVRLVPRLAPLTEPGLFLVPREPLSARRVETPPELRELPKEWRVWEPPVLYENERGEGVLLGIGDSFQWQMMPFLANHFRRAYFLSMQAMEFPLLRQIAKMVGATVVLEERVERNMKWTPEPHPAESGG